MPVEPGLVDANVLVYAMDADASQHAASRTLLEDALDGSTTLYVSLQVLCEFYSIVTNARRVLKPRSSADALSAISGLLGFLHVLPVPVQTMEALLGLLRRRP
jgi:predicted nucleic acid-binding protein